MAIRVVLLEDGRWADFSYRPCPRHTDCFEVWDWDFEKSLLADIRADAMDGIASHFHGAPEKPERVDGRLLTRRIHQAVFLMDYHLRRTSLSLNPEWHDGYGDCDIPALPGFPWDGSEPKALRVPKREPWPPQVYETVLWDEETGELLPEWRLR